MLLPDEVSEQLPKELKPQKITAYLKIPKGLKGAMGETHLFVQETTLFVLSRASFSAPLVQEALDPEARPHTEKSGFQPVLCLKTADGKEHRLSILLQEQEVEELLQKLSRDTSSPGRASIVHENANNDREDASIVHEDGGNDREDASIVHENANNDREDAPIVHESANNDREDAPIIHERANNDREDTSIVHEDANNDREDAPIVHEDGGNDREDASIVHENANNDREDDLDDDDDEEDEDEDDLDDDDLDDDDPLLMQAIQEIQGKRYAEAAASARALAQKTSDEDDEESYEVLARALDLLQSGDLGDSFFLSINIGYLSDIGEVFEMALGAELEAKGEPFLAWTTFNMSTADGASARASAIEEGLGLSKEEIERRVDERCVVWYRQEIEKNPENAHAWEEIAEHLQDLEQHEEAIESAKRAIALDPERLWPYLTAGDALLAREQPQEALSFWNQAEARFPEEEGPYQRLGGFYEKRGNIARAIEYYQKGFAASPSYYSASKDPLRRLLRQGGRWEDLAALLEEIVERSQYQEEEKNAAIKELVEIYEERLGLKRKADQWRGELPREEPPAPRPLSAPKRPKDIARSIEEASWQSSAKGPGPESPAPKRRVSPLSIIIWVIFFVVVFRFLLSWG